MKMLYKFSLKDFLYQKLILENANRGLKDQEYELVHTYNLKQDKYLDVFVEYAKAEQEEILTNITAINRSSEAADLHLLPTLWFRNTWSWGYADGPMGDVSGKPFMKQFSQ